MILIIAKVNAKVCALPGEISIMAFLSGAAFDWQNFLHLIRYFDWHLLTTSLTQLLRTCKLTYQGAGCPPLVNSLGPARRLMSSTKAVLHALIEKGILVHSLQNSDDLGASNPVLSDDLSLGNQMACRTEAADPATQLFGNPALACKRERSERSDPFPKKPLPWKPWFCRFVSRPGTGLVLLNHLARRLILQDILLAKN